jgi:acetoin utilization deacetylase AcuC-like enzyme
MTLLYYDPVFLEHETGNHPEHPRRLEFIWKRLVQSGLDQQCQRRDWQPVSIESLELVHDPEYIASIEAYAKQGGGWIEPDTFICPRSYDVARIAAGAACDAARAVVTGQSRNAFCLVRPPGHHALSDEVMGFCLFNNIAVAAATATRSLGLEKVLIVDWDVHHGNGTQAIFWEDPQVSFFSMHRYPFYPGTGSASECGAGPGKGYTCNLPIKFGTSREKILANFENSLIEFAKKIRPELVLISAGFDAHRADPIGSLGLETADFKQLSNIVINVARQYAAGKIVSILEGGYHPVALADSAAVHLQALLSA